MADGVGVATRHGVAAWVAGRVEEGPRQMPIEPIGMTFTGETLGVRARFRIGP